VSSKELLKKKIR